ncbi:hypothetical protein SRIMM317S_04009 [Streptomyces rimosus subsp. rimosus]
MVAQADNSSKGNKSPGEWLVPNNYGGFACDYARAYVQVKYHYGLSILETDPKNTKIKKQIHDKTALQKALNTCPRSGQCNIAPARLVAARARCPNALCRRHG